MKNRYLIFLQERERNSAFVKSVRNVQIKDTEIGTKSINPKGVNITINGMQIIGRRLLSKKLVEISNIAALLALIVSHIIREVKIAVLVAEKRIWNFWRLTILPVEEGNTERYSKNIYHLFLKEKNTQSDTAYFVITVMPQ